MWWWDPWDLVDFRVTIAGLNIWVLYGFINLQKNKSNVSRVGMRLHGFDISLLIKNHLLSLHNADLSCYSTGSRMCLFSTCCSEKNLHIIMWKTNRSWSTKAATCNKTSAFSRESFFQLEFMGLIYSYLKCKCHPRFICFHNVKPLAALSKLKVGRRT